MYQQETISSTNTEITQRTSVNVEPTVYPYFKRYRKLTILAIKVTVKGKATFIVAARIKGNASAVRYSIGNVNDYTVKDARKEALLIIANARRGYAPRYTREEKSPKTHSLRCHLEDYLTRKDIRQSTAQTYRNQCNNAFADCYKIAVDGISSQMNADKRLELTKRYSSNYTAS